MVEFALVLIMLLVVLCGIIEFAVYGKNVLAIANATREGARAAAVGKTISTVRSTVQRFASPLTTSGNTGSVNLEVSSNAGTSYTTLSDNLGGTQNAAVADQYIRVTTTATNKSVTGFFGTLFNRSFNQQVVMRRENTS